MAPTLYGYLEKEQNQVKTSKKSVPSKTYKASRKTTVKAAMEPEKTKTTTHKSTTSSIRFANAPTQHTTTTTTTEKKSMSANSTERGISSITTLTSNHLPTTTQRSQSSITNDSHNNSAPNYTQVASNASPNDSKSASSTGGLVGAVVAAAAIVALAAGAFLIFRKKKKARHVAQRRFKPDPFTMGYGNQDYPPPLGNDFPPPSAYGIVESDTKDKVPITALAPSPSILPSVHGTIPGMQPGPTGSPSAISVAPSVMTHATGSTMPIIGKFVVVATYVPTLSDEIEIEPGDKVDLLVEYDDGWCQGINTTRGNIKGVFPRHCIDHLALSSNRGSAAPSMERSKRVSSMM
ncbi:hypothetical protein BD560DRAFT_145227 [Blakeslea trispora]|nr:hypothetical protein BD560DRAFT_145227 [Blakeslea trispora]